MAQLDGDFNQPSQHVGGVSGNLFGQNGDGATFCCVVGRGGRTGEEFSKDVHLVEGGGRAAIRDETPRGFLLWVHLTSKRGWEMRSVALRRHAVKVAVTQEEEWSTW
jgi:hypothetical protein